MDYVESLKNQIEEREKALKEINKFEDEIEKLINDYIEKYCVPFKKLRASIILEKARKECMKGIRDSLPPPPKGPIKIERPGFSIDDTNNISDQSKYFNSNNTSSN